ncbi:MAG: hypothetical protein ABH886_06180 [Candidatus Desantisbacteria bacterium]
MAKMENKATYRFFKGQFEELLAQGFSKEQACIILKRIHSAIDHWRGYHYANVCYSAGQSLEYLINQVQQDTQEQELKEHTLDNAITYKFQKCSNLEA